MHLAALTWWLFLTQMAFPAYILKKKKKQLWFWCPQCPPFTRWCGVGPQQQVVFWEHCWKDNAHVYAAGRGCPDVCFGHDTGGSVSILRWGMYPQDYCGAPFLLDLNFPHVFQSRALVSHDAWRRLAHCPRSLEPLPPSLLDICECQRAQGVWGPREEPRKCLVSLVEEERLVFWMNKDHRHNDPGFSWLCFLGQNFLFYCGIFQSDSPHISFTQI